MNEAELTAAVLAECRALCLTVFHFPDSMRVTSRGWPDLAILGPRRTLYRELKSADGRLTKEQIRTGQLLRGCGFDWAVWRPADWDDGTIARALQGLRW